MANSRKPRSPKGLDPPEATKAWFKNARLVLPSMSAQLEELRVWVLQHPRERLAKAAGLGLTTLVAAWTPDTWNPRASTIIALDDIRRAWEKAAR